MTPEERDLLAKLDPAKEISPEDDAIGATWADMDRDHRFTELCQRVNSLQLLAHRLGLDWVAIVKTVDFRRSLINALRDMAQKGFDDSDSPECKGEENGN